MNETPLLRVRDLTTVFHGDTGSSTVLDRISFDCFPGETLCIVGESGCGKSVTSLSVMGLLGRNGRVTGGSVQFDGRELTALSEKELDRIRGSSLTMVFQDALTSLNPVFSVGNQLCESIRAHASLTRQQARQRAAELLLKVGLPDPEAMLKKYPFELSGGQRQRVMIAMALCCDPKLLIADEPTTALDVTIQAQIMSLLRRLQRETGMSMILITHDIGLVAQMADRVLVMYAGQFVEEAPAHELFYEPQHPYTKALLASVPNLLDDPGRVLTSIAGTVPEHYDTMTGCRFAGRCPHACPACSEPQPLRQTGPQHLSRCLLAEGKEAAHV